MKSLSISLKEYATFGGVLVASLSVLYWRSFHPDYVVFSNDGPLGAINNEASQMPDNMFGRWNDLNHLGNHEPSASPGPTMAFRWLVGPLYFAKFYPIYVQTIMGVSAFYALRRLRLHRNAQWLGGLAASHMSGFFSNTAWGIGGHQITVAMTMFAIGLLVEERREPNVTRKFCYLALAGCAVGIGIMEGADIGILYSLLIVAFMLWQVMFQKPNV